MIDLSSLPSPNAALKSCAVGPSRRTAGSAPLKFHVDSGIATSCSSTFFESTATKFSFAFRSLVHCQLTTPGSRLQYWLTAPLAGLMATVKPTPPVARAPKKLLTEGWKSKFCESAQMNDPTVVAFARRPAAKL